MMKKKIFNDISFIFLSFLYANVTTFMGHKVQVQIGCVKGLFLKS